MSDRPLVSVIIPVFNAEKNIERCIQSLLKQQYSDFEILVIDDGSTDNTLSILDHYNKNEKIRIFYQENKGVSVARNLGIKNSRGKYIGFVDADDEVLPNFLNNLVRAINIKEDIDVSICGFEIKDAKTKKLNYKTNFQDKIVSSENLISHIFDSNGPMGFVWNKLWKKEVIDKNQISFRADVTMAEDLIFVIDYLLCSKNVFIINSIEYVYYQNSNSLSSSFKVKKQVMNFVPAYEHYKKSGYIIENKLKGNAKLKIAAEANIVQINLGFLRNLNLNRAVGKENNDLYKNLRHECLKYKKSYFSSSMTNNTKKIIYNLTIYFAPLMSKIDILLNTKRFSNIYWKARKYFSS